jgi:hypothetical protein
MFTFEDLVTVPPATIREIVSGWTSGSWRWRCAAPTTSCAPRSSSHEFAGRGDAEGGHGGAGPGALARGGAGAAGDPQPGPALEAEGKVILKLETGDEMLA